MAVVPGYPNLRYIGGAASKPAEQQISPTLLQRLQQAALALGQTIDIFSGAGGPSVRGAGFAGDPHSRGVAVDAQINGQPIGNFPGAVGVLHSLGLRSGATDFTYQGRPDPAHVDLYPFSSSTGSKGATNEGAAATGTSIKSPDAFWYAVETKLGLPHTRAVHTFLQGWANVENTKAQFNPLATTQTEPGSTNFNDHGVQNYPTPDVGVTATADTLRGYPAILAILRRGTNPASLGYSPQVNAELNKWQSGKPNPSVTPYVKAVFDQASNNSKSAADWFSYDANNLKHDVAKLTGLDYLGKLFDVHNILRGLQVVAGGVLVLSGVLLLARQVGLAADVPAPPVRPPIPPVE